MSRTRLRRLATVSAAVLTLTGLTACSDDSSPTVGAGGSSSSSQADGGQSSDGASSSQSSSSAPSPSSSSATSAASPTSSTAAGSASTLVKLCGDDTVQNKSTNDEKCPSNAKDFSGSRLICSVDLPSDVTGKVSGTIYRNGAKVFGGDIQRVSGTQGLNVHYSVGKLQMPGGSYDCVWKAGSRTFKGTTTVKGATQRASQVMACEGKTMHTDGQVKHCTKNTPSISSPATVGCSAVVTDLIGHSVAVAVNTPTGPKRADLGRSIQTGVAVVYVTLDSRAFGGGIPKGGYTCDFLVDEGSVGKTSFTVS